MISYNAIDTANELPPAISAHYARCISQTPGDVLRTMPFAFPVGAGGCLTLAYYRDRPGYRTFEIIESIDESSVDLSKPYARLVEEVQAGFGRTFARLPGIFGVSRQTLYNWRNGETPKPVHQEKLVQLAAAAREFTAAKFEPSALMLERTVTQGKSFLTLLADGADGADTAKRLMRIVERGLRAKADLAAIGETQHGRDSGSLDIATPAWGEDA